MTTRKPAKMKARKTVTRAKASTKAAPRVPDALSRVKAMRVPEALQRVKALRTPEALLRVKALLSQAPISPV